MARSNLCVVLASGCVWVNEDAGRLDQDGDQIAVTVDCNDENADVSTLQGWDGDLACGDVVEADVVEASNTLRVVNCIHPIQLEDLVVLGRNEQVYRFLSSTPTDVDVTLLTNAFVLDLDDRDTGGVALIANRGAACELDTCEVGLPLAPTWYRTADPSGGQPPWDPVVRFRAESNEAWYVVVSGGRWGDHPMPSPYTLTVGCLP
jgi:hypothetical protein